MKICNESAYGRPSDSLFVRSRLVVGSCLLALAASPASAQAACDFAAKVTYEVAVDTIPAPPQVQLKTSWTGAGWQLAWAGFAPGTLMLPVLRVSVAGTDTTLPFVVAAPLPVDASGSAQMFLPRLLDTTVDLVVGGVATASAAGVSSAPNPLGASGPDIGGWHLYAQSCMYEPTATPPSMSGSIGRLPPLPPPSAATTLWAAVVDESSAGATLVHVVAFDPAALVPNQPGVDISCNYTLPAGHTLSLYVFDKDPSESELAGALLLWQS